MTLSERIFEMAEAGIAPKEIAQQLNMDGMDVNRIIYRLRKRARDKAAEVVAE